MRVPRTVIRYISAEFAKTFLLTLVIVTAVWVLGMAIVTVRHEMLGPRAFLAAMPLLAVISTKYTLPMAVLFGASIAYGRMSAENEIRAMEWNGIHVGWVILPAAIIAVFASVLALALDCDLIPAAYRNFHRLIRTNIVEIVEKQLSRSAQGGIPLSIGNYTVSITGYDKATRAIRGITVFETDSLKRPVRRIDAARATIVPGKVQSALPIVMDEDLPESERKYVTFVFQDGVVMQFDPDSTKVTSRYAAPPVAIDLSSEKEKDSGLKGMSSRRLARFARRTAKPADRLEALTDFYERLALGISPLFFVLLAAPMASLVRWRHNLTAFLPGMAVVMVVYYPLLVWAKVWGEAGRFPPAYGMFAGNVALLLVSGVTIVVLLRR